MCGGFGRYENAMKSRYFVYWGNPDGSNGQDLFSYPHHSSKSVHLPVVGDPTWESTPMTFD